MWMLPKHPGLFVWLHLCDWLTVVAVLGFAKKKYVFFYEDMRSVKEKTWTRELEGLKHPKWELHEAMDIDNWPTITYLSTFYLTLLTRHSFLGSWESNRIHADFSWNFGHLHTVILGSGFDSSSLPRFWTLLWRTPSSDGGSSGRLLKKIEATQWLEIFQHFFSKLCFSFSTFREKFVHKSYQSYNFQKENAHLNRVFSSDPWGFQTFHRWLRPTERAM